MTMITTRKKLIEVALPLVAINAAAAHEKMPGIGSHPRGLHLWWARRPLASARAVIFAQMVDDPSSCPELFCTEEAQSIERQRLFGIIEELVKWGNTTNEAVLETAREEIRKSWRRACEDNQDHPTASELFNPDRLPAFHDPFAGGGSIPMEAQRLGLEAYASDLNPVAVLINKAMIEIPPKFEGRSPVNPDTLQGKGSTDAAWKGAAGLAEDVRFYGQWMRDEAEKRIGHLYPKVDVSEEMVRERPDLEQYKGRKLTVIAWLWARTVKSPNPAFATVDVPLVSTFVLSNRKGKESYVEPVIDDSAFWFTVKTGMPPASAKLGTTAGKRSAFLCLMSGVPVPYDHIRTEGKAGRMGTRLMAIVAEGDRGRLYLPPTSEHAEIVQEARPEWMPDIALPDNPRDFKTPNYGLNTFGDLFTQRQAMALTTFSDLVTEARDLVRQHAVAAGVPDDGAALQDGGIGATAYADAVGVYLAFAVDRCADFSNSCTRWVPSNEKGMNLFGKQAIAMTWDFPEAAILNHVVGGFGPATEFIAKCVATLPQRGVGHASAQNATASQLATGKIISTDPPYYDNIGYADLSDFFYVWLRRSLQKVFPDVFATMTVPKAEELVATPYRHGSKEQAEAFFLYGMTSAMQRLAEQSHPTCPVTIYYAFKQSERKGESGVVNTGWATFLDAVIQAGFGISGTWPIRSEQQYRMVGMGTNALASSIILVCRPLSADAPVATRREFIEALKSELPDALHKMQQGSIAPVDLAQASIGPGMAIFTRYARVLDSSGEAVTVREALSLINQTLDEVLAEQAGDFDAETRWALAWFEQSGFDQGEYGAAETLSTAKNTSVSGMVEAGILDAAAGRVRLLKSDELPDDWDPEKEQRLTIWESVHHLVRVLDQGEETAAELMAALGPNAEAARELAYRLYRICEQKNRAQEALGYNALVQSWPEMVRLTRQVTRVQQGTMFSQE